MTVMEDQRAGSGILGEPVGSDRSVRLIATGELDTVTSVRFMVAGREALSGRHHTTLEIDMSQVTFIDAAGVGALVAIRNHSRSNDNSVAVTEASRWVLRILGLTGLTGTFIPATERRLT
jgi:anti-sigma B factor antagonist